MEYQYGTDTTKHTAVMATELDNVSHATRLLEKKRQKFEVDEALEIQQQETFKKQQAFSRREEGLKQKDRKLQDSLVEFNGFLQESEKRRTKADKKAQDEAKIRKAKEIEIVQIKAEVQNLKERCTQLKHVVSKNLKYQKYLETVQDAAPEDFPQLDDIVNRYATLQDANQDLQNRLKLHETLNDTERTDLVHYSKEQINAMLSYHNQIADMQKFVENAESKTSKLQADVDAEIRSESDRILEIGQSINAIRNLHMSCSSLGRGSNAQIDTKRPLVEVNKVVMKQLDDIAASILDYRAIIQLTKSMNSSDSTVA